MATGRIGVTPTLGTRWSKAPAGGTTSLSGLDDNSVALVYSVGYEQVYRNGVLLSRGNDYTATTGNSITLTDATIAGDIIEVFANELVPLTDAISKGQFTAKGALLSATAASTPGVLTVGSNDQVLTADSSTATGLKWATPSGGGSTWTLLNAGGTALTGATTITVSGISAKDKIMVFVDEASSANAQAQIGIRFNTDTASNYYPFGGYNEATASAVSQLGTFRGANDRFVLGRMENDALGRVTGSLFIQNASATSGVKMVNFLGSAANVASGETQRGYLGWGYYDSTSTISSISVVTNTGNFDNGTVYVYTSAS